MKKLIFYMLPLMVVFASCKKDGDDNPSKEPACYIKTYKQVGSSFNTYEYDANNNITKISHEGPSGPTGSTVYKWENGQNVRITGNDAAGNPGYYYDVKYMDGQVSSMQLNQYIQQSGQFGVVEKDTIVSENGQIKEFYAYKLLGPNWKLDNSSKFEYDANGNMIKRTNYDSQGMLTGTTETDVNTGKNSQYRYLVNALSLSSKNLRTEIRSYGPTGGLNSTTKITVASENAYRYPEDLTLSNGSASEQQIYTYECK